MRSVRHLPTRRTEANGFSQHPALAGLSTLMANRSALFSDRIQPWIPSAIVAMVCGTVYLAFRPPIFDSDGYSDLLAALGPNRIDNIDPLHLLSVPIQILLVTIVGAKGYPPTMPFQVLGIALNCATPFSVWRIVAEVHWQQAIRHIRDAVRSLFSEILVCRLPEYALPAPAVGNGVMPTRVAHQRRQSAFRIAFSRQHAVFVDRYSYSRSSNSFDTRRRGSFGPRGSRAFRSPTGPINFLGCGCRRCCPDDLPLRMVAGDPWRSRISGVDNWESRYPRSAPL